MKVGVVGEIHPSGYEIFDKNNIDISIVKGQIHALLGENGAGKSTLVKIF